MDVSTINFGLRDFTKSAMAGSVLGDVYALAVARIARSFFSISKRLAPHFAKDFFSLSKVVITSWSAVEIIKISALAKMGALITDLAFAIIYFLLGLLGIYLLDRYHKI